LMGFLRVTVYFCQRNIFEIAKIIRLLLNFLIIHADI
jgi:hypothetical protein